MMFKGDLSVMSTRPLALALLGIAAAYLVYRFVSIHFLKKKVGLKVGEKRTYEYEENLLEGSRSVA